MKKLIIIISASIAVAALAVAVFVFGLFYILDKEQSKDFYTLGDDQVPSLTYVAGEQKLNGFSFNMTGGHVSKEYRYRTSKGMEDGTLYTSYLVEEENFVKQEAANGQVNYIKASSDPGMILNISVFVNEKGIKITIRKIEEVTGWVKR